MLWMNGQMFLRLDRGSLQSEWESFVAKNSISLRSKINLSAIGTPASLVITDFTTPFKRIKMLELSSNLVQSRIRKLRILDSFILSQIYWSPTWIKAESISQSFALIIVGRVGWQMRFSKLGISSERSVATRGSSGPFSKILPLPSINAAFALSACYIAENSPPGCSCFFASSLSFSDFSLPLSSTVLSVFFPSSSVLMDSGS